MSQETKTTTKIEAVEVELYECGICEQDYEEEEVFEIGIDMRDAALDDGVQANHTDYICKYCSDSNFDYSGEPSELLTAFVTGWKNDLGIGETLLAALFVGGAIGIAGSILLFAISLVGMI